MDSRPSRARPVADAPVVALTRDAEGVARDWLVELVGASPLAAAAALPVAELARSGPALCASMARALASDDELDRLRAGGDLRGLAALPAAPDAAATLAAVEARRRALWAAAMAAWPRATADMVGDLAQRLAAVCAEVAAAALDPGQPANGPVAGRAPRVQPTVREAYAAGAPPLATDPVPEPWEAGAPPIVRPPIASAAPEPQGEEPRVADGDPHTHLAARAAEFLADGRPFAALLVELDGIESLLAADQDGEVRAAVDAAEQALEDLLRPGDAIRRESPGRLWLTLPGAGPAGARALALRAAAAVERAAAHRGTPLTASVGMAVCPRDGADAEHLAEVAETALVEAQAAGVRGGSPPAL